MTELICGEAVERLNFNRFEVFNVELRDLADPKTRQSYSIYPLEKMSGPGGTSSDANGAMVPTPSTPSSKIGAAEAMIPLSPLPSTTSLGGNGIQSMTVQLPPARPNAASSPMGSNLTRMASINAVSAPYVAQSRTRRLSLVTSAESGDFVFSIPRERRGSAVSNLSARSGVGSFGAGPVQREDVYDDEDDEDEDDEGSMAEDYVAPGREPLRVDTSNILAASGDAHELAISPRSTPTSAGPPQSGNGIAITVNKASSASLGTFGDQAPPPRFSKARKNFILATVALAGLVAPLCTTVYLPAIATIQEDLQTTEVLINLTVSLFVVVLAIAPLVWAPVSDTLGRRPVYLISLSLLVVASAACAGSVNVEMLIVFRMLQATGSSSVLSIGAGTISDIFEPKERGRALGLFFLGPLIGPVIGPVIGGTLSQYVGWRWIFGFVSAVSFVILLMVYFLLPETLLKTKSYGSKKRPSFFAMALELRHPFVTLVILNICLIFVSLYGVTTLFSRQMSTTYGFSDSVIGLLFLGQGFGNIAGSLFGGWYSDWTMSARRVPDEMTGLIPPLVPEHRLITSWVGAVLLPGGLLMYGWGLQKVTSWLVPFFGTVLLGAGLMMYSTSCQCELSLSRLLSASCSTRVFFSSSI